MLSDRQNSILKQLLKNPNQALSIKDLLPFFKVSRTTLFRDLSTMLKQDLLLADAQTRARTYRLNPLSDAYLIWDLSRPPQQRQQVTYNPTLLENYQPNETFLLSDTQRTLLSDVGNIAYTESLPSDKNYTRLISTLLIDLAHASSNLENVPISWLDTKTLIEFGEYPNSLDKTQLKIVLNHKMAINYLTSHAETIQPSQRDIFDLHSLIAKDLIADASVIGTLRQHIVRFSDSGYMPPDNPHLLKEAFEQFCNKARAIRNPYEQAFFIMIFIPYLQPFQDGNKRTSRLSMNIPLLKNHLAPFAFTDLSKGDYMFGLLAFYERGQHRFLAHAFVEAYQKTAPRYAELLNYIQQGGILGTLS